MNLFNYHGLITMVIIMIPNVVFALKNKDGFINNYHNKTIEILEQIGRYSAFLFMVFNFPFTYFGFWFVGGGWIYVVVNAVLVLTYCFIWIIQKRCDKVFFSLSQSIIPSIIFLFSGIMILSVPLIVSSLIFAFADITLSYKNATNSK